MTGYNFNEYFGFFSFEIKLIFKKFKTQFGKNKSIIISHSTKCVTFRDQDTLC